AVEEANASELSVGEGKSDIMDDDVRGSGDKRESAPHQLDDELFLYEGEAASIWPKCSGEGSLEVIGDSEEVVIPSTVTTLGDCAFCQFNGGLIGMRAEHQRAGACDPRPKSLPHPPR
ncbi:hypothetical protein THAOC_37609, partial [Thalassiosira oceanica]